MPVAACVHHAGRRPCTRPHVVHAGQGHKVGLRTPTILGGNSHLSWFYGRGAIKDQAHTGTSKGLSQAINRGPIRKFLPNYANVYVTIQSHAVSAVVRSHYVTAYGVRNGLAEYMTSSRRPPPTATNWMQLFSVEEVTPAEQSSGHRPMEIQ